MEKNRITAIILTKNEENRLAGCLDSIAWVDEIIVVDNGSTDDTRDIAKKYKAKIVVSDSRDFSVLRMKGRDASTGAWLLYIDADETVPADLAREIRATVDGFTESDPKGYFITRRTWYLGHEWPVRDKMQRFFYRPALTGWSGPLHETALVDGAVATLKNPLLHHTHRTLEEMVSKTNEWSTVEAGLRADAQHPPVVWWRLLRVMATGFWTSYSAGGWRMGTVGLIESIYQGFSMFITYAKLWEMQQQ